MEIVDMDILGSILQLIVDDRVSAQEGVELIMAADSQAAMSGAGLTGTKCRLRYPPTGSAALRGVVLM